VRRIDIIVIATICIVFVGAAVIALVVLNQPPERPTSIFISNFPQTAPVEREAYARGERINTDGLVIRAVFPNRIETITSGLSFSTLTATNGGLFDNPAIIDQQITVSFRGVTAPEPFTIRVGPSELREMRVLSFRRNYRLNDKFDSANFRAELVWTDHHRNTTITHQTGGLEFSILVNGTGDPIPLTHNVTVLGTRGIHTIIATNSGVSAEFEIVVV
jgi:hypothetical protein